MRNHTTIDRRTFAVALGLSLQSLLAQFAVQCALRRDPLRELAVGGTFGRQLLYCSDGLVTSSQPHHTSERSVASRVITPSHTDTVTIFCEPPPIAHAEKGDRATLTP